MRTSLCDVLSAIHVRRRKDAAIAADRSVKYPTVSLEQHADSNTRMFRLDILDVVQSGRKVVRAD